MLLTSHVFLISLLFRDPALPQHEGPSRGNTHGYEAVAEVNDRLQRLLVSTQTAQVSSYMDGDPTETIASAVQQCSSNQNNPLIVLLTVNASPTSDVTLIEYGVGAEEEAAAMTAHITSLGARWAITQAASPDRTLPTECATLRITLGSVNGTSGRSFLSNETWLQAISDKIALGIIAATAVPAPTP